MNNLTFFVRDKYLQRRAKASRTVFIADVRKSWFGPDQDNDRPKDHENRDPEGNVLLHSFLQTKLDLHSADETVDIFTRAAPKGHGRSIIVVCRVVKPRARSENNSQAIIDRGLAGAAVCILGLDHLNMVRAVDQKFFGVDVDSHEWFSWSR